MHSSHSINFKTHDRYLFQGQEMDDEVKGEGNSVNYTFRMHDPRLGRFFAIDPLADQFPYYSPYQFCSNSPILAVEFEGLESSVQLNFSETSVSISRNEDNQFIITTDQLNQIPSNNKAMANGAWGIRDLRAGGQWELYCPDCMGPYGGGAYVRLILPKLQVIRYIEVEKEREVIIPGTPEIPAKFKNINKETSVLSHYRNGDTQAENLKGAVDFAGIRVKSARGAGKFKSLNFVAKVDNAETRQILAKLKDTYGSVNFSINSKMDSDYSYQAIYSIRVKIKDKVAAVPDKVVIEKYTEKVPVTVDPIIITP
jgi:RHS repeat-associated protein